MCVRLVKMKGVDLEQFQFDYDLTWSAILLHPDGTVFARYGSRDEAGPMTRNSIEGLMATMKRVLDAFDDYPENREVFTSKVGPRPDYQRVERMPSATVRKLVGATTQENCIHCHNVYHAQHEIAVDNGHYDPRKLWKYPLPESIGLVLDGESGNRVSQVRPDMAASRAGIKAGDEIEMMNGQAIYSIADFQFVLHHLAEDGSLDVRVRRGAAQSHHRVVPSDGWREGNLAWRVSMYNMPPQPRLWVEALDSPAKRGLGIDEDGLAIRVRGVFGSAVQKAGLSADDVIVACDGQTKSLTEGQFHSSIRLNHYKPGSELPLTVLRDGRKRQLTVRF